MCTNTTGAYLLDFSTPDLVGRGVAEGEPGGAFFIEGAEVSVARI